MAAKIITTALPDGSVGTPYTQTLQASGGVAPLKWSVSPALPASLTLDAATGTISGTPAAALAKTKFTFEVIDSSTPAASSIAELTLEIKPAAGATDKISAAQEPMSKCSRVSIFGYLLLGTILTCYVILSLWSAQPRLATQPVPEPQCSKTTTAPVLSRLYPDHVFVGSTSVDILILGCNFTSKTNVKFNGTPRPFLFVDSSHIRVGLTGADVAAASAIVVTLSNDGSDFGSVMVHVIPPEVSWEIFWAGPWTISLELQLLLLVLFTGAFGSCVYALKSFADYLGENKLYDAWTGYYWIQPFEGAGIAFLLYLVVRGGFLAGTSADVKAVNMFGICAIAGLSGAFSDTAFLKLREVFLTLFKPQDDRSGKISPMRVITTTLPDGSVGTPYTQTLQASGGVAPLKWSVSPALPASLTLDAATGTISGTPAAAVRKTKFTFKVTDSSTPAASSVAELTLEIK